jgi:hypothetical protein
MCHIHRLQCAAGRAVIAHCKCTPPSGVCCSAAAFWFAWHVWAAVLYNTCTCSGALRRCWAWLLLCNPGACACACVGERRCCMLVNERLRSTEAHSSSARRRNAYRQRQLRHSGRLQDIEPAIDRAREQTHGSTARLARQASAAKVLMQLVDRLHTEGAVGGHQARCCCQAAARRLLLGCCCEAAAAASRLLLPRRPPLTCPCAAPTWPRAR